MRQVVMLLSLLKVVDVMEMEGEMSKAEMGTPS